MLTSGHVAYMRGLAESIDEEGNVVYDYARVKGTDRPSASYNGGSPRKGLRAYLYAAQGGVCVECDNARGPLDLETAETAHVVSRGPKVKGFMPGNLMVVHTGCNADQKARGEVVDPSTLARPDLVVMTWPCAKTSGFYVYARKA